MTTTPSKKGPEPPKKPKYRTINDLSKAVVHFPYFLAGDPDIIREHMENGRENELYMRDDVFAVGVGMLTFRNYLQYENLHAETLDIAANRLMYVFYAMSKIMQPDIDDNPVPELITDEETRVTETPYGKMYGSLERNGTLLLVYLLSQKGRIVGQNADGSFDYEEVNSEDLIDMLDPTAIFAMDEEEGKSLFVDVLELTGLYDPGKAATKLKEAGALQDDETKNSASRNGGNSRTKGSSTRRRTNEK